MCQHHQVCTTMCMCVSFSQTFSKGLVTQLATPLDPSDDAKLDHSSGTRWPICKQVCPLDSTAIYPKPGHQLLYTHMTGEMKCPRLYLCLAHFIPSPPMSMQHMHQHDQQWYDPLHIIMWSYWFINLDFTCFSPLPSLAQASSPRSPSLQSLRLALHACNRSIKPSHVLIFSTLITWLNVMSHVQ